MPKNVPTTALTHGPNGVYDNHMTRKVELDRLGNEMLIGPNTENTGQRKTNQILELAVQDVVFHIVI